MSLGHTSPKIARLKPAGPKRFAANDTVTPGERQKWVFGSDCGSTDQLTDETQRLIEVSSPFGVFDCVAVRGRKAAGLTLAAGRFVD